ncbi:MAG: ATP-binding cassette domain-containing protein, partial [Chloroflexota bacterium]
MTAQSAEAPRAGVLFPGLARPIAATQDRALSDTATGAGHAMRVEELSAWYGAHLAVKQVSLDVKPRAVTALIGPSGCGKST